MTSDEEKGFPNIKNKILMKFCFEVFFLCFFFFERLQKKRMKFHMNEEDDIKMASFVCII